MSWKRMVQPSKADQAWLAREFGKKARFLVDEALTGLGTEVLTGMGYNALEARQVGLSGHSDADIFAFAWKEKRLIVTQDRGFLDDRRFPFNRNPGVLILPGGPVDREGFIAALRTAIQLVGRYHRLFEGQKIVFGEGGEIAIRDRDPQSGAIKTRRYKLGRHGGEYEWVDDEYANPTKRGRQRARTGRAQALESLDGPR